MKRRLISKKKSIAWYYACLIEGHDEEKTFKFYQLIFNTVNAI